MLLSTCNRTEIYAHATLFHPAMQDVRDFLADTSGVDPDEFADLLYTYHDDAAVAHLFGVAAGLDSMIIGEGEILGQVREAWQRRRARGRERAAAVADVPPRDRGRQAGPHRDRDRPPRGVGLVGRGRAGRASRLGSLDDRRVLVLGAGEMGEGMALALARRGRAARSSSPTAPLARAVDARRAGRRPRRSPLDELPDALVACDVLLAVHRRAPTCSSSAATIEAVMERRDGRALLVVDVGVPRDVDPGAGEVFGVTLLDIDDLARVRRAVARAAAPGDRPASARSSPRSSTATGSSAPRARSRRSSPRCARAPRTIRAAELERFRAKLDALDPDDARRGRGAHARASSTSCCTSRPSA